MLNAGLAALVLCTAAPLPTPAVDRELRIRMRDGTLLRADLLRPPGPGPFPTLVYRTPYDRKRAVADRSTFGAAVARGYAVLVEDVRGRYDSEGEFVPYRNEGKDGYDTIEWAAAQPWSDGRVGSFGLSYPGAVQWLAAVESPPHLLAMAPAMTFSTARNFVYSGGVFDGSWVDWIWNNIAPDVRVRKGLPGPRSTAEARRAWATLRAPLARRLPISELPELRGVAPWLFEWMKTPPGDPAWDWLEIRGKYERVSAAVLNLSGWHDEAYGPEGAATNYLGLLTARRGVDPRAQLVLGPWVHGSVVMQDRAAQSRSGERSFGPDAAIDYDELVLRFMDHYLRGIENGVGGEKPVRLFVMGENAWRNEEAWPPASAWPMTLYLHGPAGARPGRLTEQAPVGEAAPSRFVSDPLAPVSDAFAEQAGAHDYRALARRLDVATFETEPLAAAVRVLGTLSALVQLSTDAPDADLWVKLFDVAPDGTAWNLMSPGLDVQRASYRHGGPGRVLLEPAKPCALRFDELMTGNLFARGHRIRLVLAGAFFPHFSRNLQTGELETASSSARKAEFSIHHDAAHASWITLPVVP